MNRALWKDKGMRTFLWVWFGQLVSLFGTGMTRFALTIWAYQQTSSALTLALLGTFNYIPYLIFSPIAGVLVDRMDRRKLMFLSDLLSGMITMSLLALYLSGSLRIWHLYVADALTGLFEAFQVPAYTAACTLLVPKEHFNRTNGMRALAYNSSRVFAPLLAGALLAWLGILAVMSIDIATFLFSSIVLLVVRFPRPQQSEIARQAGGHFWQEMKLGFTFIFARPGLRGLMLVMFGINLLASLTYFSVLPAMILARSNSSEWALGIVQSVLGVGGVIGALLMTTWGGPRKKIHSVLAGGFLSFLLGDLFFAVGYSVPVWAMAAFFSTLTIPFISGGQQTIWQMKVPPDMQGRVFSVKDTLQQIFMPLGYLLGGVLADYVFEPALQSGGALSTSLGRLVGTGPGAGMAAMFLFTWAAGFLLCASGYLSMPLRNVESDLPDMV